MKVVVQRVSQASVDVVNELGTIDPTFEPQQIDRIHAARRRNR